MKTIVCFAGGTAGDLVVATLDPKNCSHDNELGKIKLSKDRSGMKKFWMYEDQNQKNSYIKQAFESYNSLPSHDVDFHITKKNYEVIGITCFGKDLRDRSATRFKNLHRSEVWDSLTKVSKAKTIEQYSDDIFEISKKLERAFPTIDLSEIIQGDLISRLTGLGYDIGSKSLKIYNDWLSHHSGVNLSPKY